MPDISKYIEKVSEWQAKEDGLPKVAFFVNNDKEELMAIFDTFVELFDFSIDTLGDFVKVTLTNKKIKV